MSDSEDRTFFNRNTLLLALVLAAGIIVPGIARRLLGLAGFTNLGRVVFLLGYGGMVLLVWYGWIRPLDLSGPSGNAPERPKE